MTAIAVGGLADHVHVLLTIPSSLALARAMQEIKAGSSRWMHTATGCKAFAWQSGYGAFSIGSSHMESTIGYITKQQEHHRRRDFQGEFLAILKEHDIEYDPRFIWG